MIWECVIEKAIRDDGSLFFPEKLTHEFLEQMRKSLGSYIFANQYMNEIIPLDKMVFKKEWVKYYQELPERRNTFIFIDPALSESESADNTGVVVVHVDSENRWYVELAQRLRIRPTAIVNLIFDLNERFKPSIIGVESVAFQKSLLYFADEELRRRNSAARAKGNPHIVLPLQGVNPGTQSTKEMRILGLVPRFEWNNLFLNIGLTDLEDELYRFPRAAHDDVLDALSSISFIAYAPNKEKFKDEPPNASIAGEYEDWYRRQIRTGRDPKRTTTWSSEED